MISKEMLFVHAAFTISKSIFNISPQKLSKSARSVLEGYHHFKGIKLTDVPGSELAILVESNPPDAFMQLELRRHTQDQMRRGTHMPLSRL